MLCQRMDPVWMDSAKTVPAKETSFLHLLVIAKDILSDKAFWIGIAPFIFLVILHFYRTRRYLARSESISLPFGLGNRTYDTTPLDRIAAWKLYVHLSTRKAAIPFNEEHDVIVEVYDSLFAIFDVARQLLLELPPNEFARKTEGIASLMNRVLNDGLRPHLTRWQATYRKWWEEAVKEEENRWRSPQELQRRFPQYDELVSDLRTTNVELSKFSDRLLNVARGPERGLWVRSIGRRLGKLFRKKVHAEAPTPEHPKEDQPSMNAVSAKAAEVESESTPPPIA